ncbi:MAG TPA: FkbM family methyltransferase [Candidatus Limnocylindrales bacterium]
MIKRRLRKVRRRLGRSVLKATRRIALRHPAPPAWLGLEKIGSDYGGWIVPTAVVTEDWVCYCGGVGEDVTFDLGLIERFGCAVHAFDPTPRAIAFAGAQAATEPRFRFHPVGLWSEDTTLRFFAPRNPAHVSHSVVNLQRTEEYFEAPCRSVANLMREIGHDRIDLLKLDIEGAEHRVIRSMLDAAIRPAVLCTEIDQPVKPRTMWKTVRRIRAAGYDLVAVDHWNLTFLRRDALVDWAAARR